jgi:hypothetical protein
MEKKECIHWKMKSGQVKTMIWSCFIGELRGTFPIISGSIIRKKYRTLLEEHLLQFMEEDYENLEEESIFIQDNASVYTAQTVKSWLH